MLEQIRVVPLESAATGPLIARFSTRLEPGAVTTILGSPGDTGSPSGSSPSPGTSVQSATWMVHGCPSTSSCPATQMPLSSSCPAGPAGGPVVPALAMLSALISVDPSDARLVRLRLVAADAGAGAAAPVTSMLPVITTRELLQVKSVGPPAVSGDPATSARLLPAGSWTALAPVRSAVR